MTTKKYSITFFDSSRDNKAKSRDMTWPEIVALLTKGHTLLKDKLAGSAFSGVRYIPIKELQKKGEKFIAADRRTGKLYPRRMNVNVRQVEVLILDFDNVLTISEAKKCFQSFEHVGYTSHGHLEKPQVEKFRIVLPLSHPISTITDGRTESDWDRIRQALIDFGGPFDQKCLDASRMFFLPAVHPDRVGTERAWHNKGVMLDPSSFPRSPSPKRLPPTERKGTAGRHDPDDLYLLPDTLLELQDGSFIRAGDVETKVEGVKCKFHDDKNGTEFIKRVPATGNIFLYCRHCRRSYFVKTDCDDDQNSERLAETKVPKSRPDKEVRIKQTTTFLSQFFEGLEYEFPNRELMFQELARIGSKILTIESPVKGRPGKYVRVPIGGETKPAHIIYTPEGSGKSALAMALAKQGHRIVFACQSWSQVAEKYAEFKQHLDPVGVPVSIAFSQEGRIQQRFGVKVIRREAGRRFRPGKINVEATFSEVQKKHPGITRKFFDFCLSVYGWDNYRILEAIHNVSRRGATLPEDSNDMYWSLDPSDFEIETEFGDETLSVRATPLSEPSGAIVLTTFALVRVVTDKKDRIPRHWLVWFDDPSIEDLSDISPQDSDNGDEDESADDVPQLQAGSLDALIKRRTRKIDGVVYEKRRKTQSLGYSVQRHLCIFTTTERLTLRALQRHLGRLKRELPEVHDGMRKLESGGKLTILGTQYVRRRFDAVFPVIVRQLEKQKKNVTLIADGVGTKYNHTSSKGLNTLVKTDTVVEISVPHPGRVRTICLVLGLSFDVEGQNIANDLMLDQMHQAIGRNVGFRGKGYECVVFVDKSRHRQLLNQCRYSFDTTNSVIIDRTKEMGRLQKRIKSSASPLVRDVEDLLNNLDRFVADRRSIQHAINHVVKAIRSDSQRLSFVSRLLASLTSLSGVKIDSEVDSTDPRAMRYREVIDFVIAKWVPEASMRTMVTDYLEVISRSQNPIRISVKALTL